MSVIKIKKSDLKPKSTIKIKKSDLGINQSSLISLQKENKVAYDMMNNYATRIQNNEWLSEADRSAYKDSVERFISSTDRLRGINQTVGSGYSRDDVGEWLKTTTSLRQGYEGVNKFYGQFADDKTYNDWFARETKRNEYQSIMDAEDYTPYDGSYRPNLGSPSTATAKELISDIAFYRHWDLDMTDDEKGVYAYYAERDPAKAEEYLSFLQDELRQRGAAREAGEINNTLWEPIANFVGGINQFMSGAQGLGNLIFGGEAPSPTQTDYLMEELQKDNTGIWKVANDLIRTTANMVPSIVVGSATGGVGGVLTMGASAAGNAYNELRAQGYDEWQARGYGLLTGASEAVLQKFLGGITSLAGGSSKGVFQTLASKVIPKVNRASARVAITLGANMADEGLEEAIQEVLDPIFKMVMTGESFEGIDIEEVAYSYLLGALSAGVLEGPGTTISSVRANRDINKRYSDLSEDDIRATINEALEVDPNNTFARKMLERVDAGETVSAFQIDRLLNETEANLIGEDITTIKDAVEGKLKEAGEQGDVSKIADAIAKKAAGKELTHAEESRIKKSKYGRGVMRELDPELIKLGHFSDKWAETLGTKKVNADVYNRGFEAKVEVDGETVSAQAEAVELSNGQFNVKMSNGATVPRADVEFADTDTDAVYRAAEEMTANLGGFGEDVANVFVNGFKAETGISADEYILGFNTAYRYGRQGVPMSDLNTSTATQKLSQTQRELAYRLGKAFATEEVGVAQKAAETRQKPKADGALKFETSLRGKTLTEVQKASLKPLEVLAKALGIDIYVYESELVDGKRVGDNAWYNPKDNSIHVDLYAGVKGEGAMLYAASHESTHYIRRWSPEKFKTFADFLFEEYGKTDGISISTLIEARAATMKNKERYSGLSEDALYDRAYEEVVADFCEQMLTDGNAMEKVQKLYTKDASLVERIATFFRNLVAKIKEAYKKLTPDSYEASRMAEMVDSFEKLSNIWSDALVSAKETSDLTPQEEYSIGNIRGEADGAVIASDTVTELVNDSDELIYSTRTELEPMPKQSMNLASGEGTLLDYIEGLEPTEIEGLSDARTNAYTGRQVREFAMRMNGFRSTQISRVNEFMDSMADFMEQAGVTYKFIGLDDVKNAKLHYRYNPDGSIKSVVLSAMVKNGDYPVNFDLSSICKKKVPMAKVIDNLAKRGSIDDGTVDLSARNIFRINEALKDAGYETACLGCFVESKRYNSLKWAQEFCKKWNDLVKRVNPNATYFGYGDNSFTDDSFSLDQAIKLENAANKYVTDTKTTRLSQALAKYKAREVAGKPLIEGKIMTVDGEKVNTFTKAARERLEKSMVIDEALKDKYLTCDVSTLTMSDVEFLLETGVLPGAALTNKQAVAALVKSGEAYQHLLRPSDLLTDRGIGQLSKLPNFTGVLYGHYGSGTPKLIQSFTPYNSEIALLPPKKGKGKDAVSLAEYLYSIAGVRMQSFSDFQVQNVYDYLQMIADLAARKLPAHAYTKEISFARILGMTGMKINLSVMFDIDPTVDSAHAGLTKYNPLIHKGEYGKIVASDSSGKWVYNVGDYSTQRAYAEAYPDESKRFLQSIGFADAVRLQTSEGYTANCGIIGVGYSDIGIVAMLNDNRIRYVIPYHASSLPADIKIATHIDLATDYTSTQNNTKINRITDRNGNKVEWTLKEAYKRLGSAQAAINELNNNVKTKGWTVETKKAQNGHGSYGLYENLQETGDPRQTTNNYIEWCVKNGTLPVFYQFGSHQNYYKLVYDFNVYDCITEEYAPQGAITNTYPTMLNGEVTAANVADGNFNTEHLISMIDKQMSFMNEYSRNLATDMETLAEHIEKGNYSLNESLLYPSERDTDYLDAVNRGDMETAQRMVDEAAREAGYTVKAYHGTKADFTEFSKEKFGSNFGNWSLFGAGFYFAPTEPSAKYWGGLSKEDADAKVMPVYLRAENMISANEPFLNDKAIEIVKEKAPTFDDSDVRWTLDRLSRFVDFLINKGYNAKDVRDLFVSIGYDGVDYSTLSAGKYRQYVVFEPNQIKSADPVTYDDNGNVIPLSERFNTEDSDIRYSERPEDSFSNRYLLANALESVAESDAAKAILADYKKAIADLDTKTARLNELNAEIKELTFGKGENDAQKLKAAREEARGLANSINRTDKRLFGLESSKVLKRVLQKEKQNAYERASQKARERISEMREGRDRTAMRHSIMRVAKELENQLFQKNLKKRYVKKGEKQLVANVLDIANRMFASDTELILDGFNVEMTDEQTAARDKFIELYNKYHSHDDAGTKNKEIRKKLRAQMAAQKRIFAEALQKERQRINDAEAVDAFKALADAYEALKNAEESYIRQAYDPNMMEHIKALGQKMGTTLVKDMSMEQLKYMYQAFRMIQKTVSNSNTFFDSERKATIAQAGASVISEEKALGDKRKVTGVGKSFSELSWNNLKPIYLMERVGSKTMQDLFQKVIDAESVWAQDVAEAVEYVRKIQEKCGYNSWDFNERISYDNHTGQEFALDLGQRMSIYAYTLRGEQALEHLRVDGFVYDKTTKVKEKGKIAYELNDKTAYKIPDDVRIAIIDSLSSEQRQYVGAIVKYLSEDMAAKGNEVSFNLLGVDLFGEENYFPIRSEHAYLEQENEKRIGTAKIKNKGFTKPTQTGARNAIVLSDFDKVWSNHVTEMSSYHAFVLPMEDFMRVYKYMTPSSDTSNKEGVVGAITNAHGEAAIRAIDQLIDDLNGDARIDFRESFGKQSVALFKKAKTVLSLSVFIQQYSAIARAQAYISPKYFVGKKLNKAQHKAAWEKIKKYAPVAVIKEMGRFDVGMGKRSADWLVGRQTTREVIDDKLSALPAYADETAWIGIWNALERETAAKNPKMSTSSEEFFKLVGKRFEDVVRHTQVYDSTLSRSGNMRSKSTFMQMITAFLAEPTTAINMREMAMRSGNKARIALTTYAVYSSVLLNAILVALPYAMRDDDEDETFAEKYLSAMVSNFTDNVNPLNALPYVKDVWSLATGYDVKRTDMTLADDVLSSIERLAREAAKEDVDSGKVINHILGLVGDLSALVGIPADNVYREIKALINTAKTITRDVEGAETTWNSLMDALAAEMRQSTPVLGWFKGDSKTDKLYNAFVKDDKAYISRFRNSYSSLTAYDTAVKRSLRDNDSRIRAAAELLWAGDSNNYLRIANEIIAEGHFPEKVIKEAIAAEADAISSEKKAALRENDARVKAAAEALIAKDTQEYNRLVNEIAAEGVYPRDIIKSAITSEKNKIVKESEIDY